MLDELFENEPISYIDTEYCKADKFYIAYHKKTKNLCGMVVHHVGPRGGCKGYRWVEPIHHRVTDKELAKLNLIEYKIE